MADLARRILNRAAIRADLQLEAAERRGRGQSEGGARAMSPGGSSGCRVRTMGFLRFGRRSGGIMRPPGSARPPPNTVLDHR